MSELIVSPAVHIKGFNKFSAKVRERLMELFDRIGELNKSDVLTFMDKCEVMQELRLLCEEENISLSSIEEGLREHFGYAPSTIYHYSSVYDTFCQVSDEVLAKIPITALREAAGPHKIEYAKALVLASEARRMLRRHPTKIGSASGALTSWPTSTRPVRSCRR